MKIIIILVITVIIYIIIKFLSDVNRQKGNIRREGGMQKKYQILLNHILSADSKARIIRVTDDSITAGVQSIGGTTLFILTQTFGNITVQWKVDSPLFGKHHLEWDFNESMNQDIMFDKISKDLIDYQNKLLQ